VELESERPRVHVIDEYHQQQAEAREDAALYEGDDYHDDRCDDEF